VATEIAGLLYSAAKSAMTTTMMTMTLHEEKVEVMAHVSHQLKRAMLLVRAVSLESCGAMSLSFLTHLTGAQL
jgi:hypothetical protein